MYLNTLAYTLNHMHSKLHRGAAFEPTEIADTFYYKNTVVR